MKHTSVSIFGLFTTRRSCVERIGIWDINLFHNLFSGIFLASEWEPDAEAPPPPCIAGPQSIYGSAAVARRREVAGVVAGVRRGTATGARQETCYETRYAIR